MVCGHPAAGLARCHRGELVAGVFQGAARAGCVDRFPLSGPQAFMTQLRIGNGYDIHRLVPGRPLILGGQPLSHPEGLGLDGHSDADVLVHALMDALLGALSLGDIGKYFPPDDPRWKGADSLVLLEQVVALIRERGWQVVNIDTVVVAERPKLRPHIEAMQTAIAARMGLDPGQVGVKATTNEKLGPEGREEGISCHAVALLQKG